MTAPGVPPRNPKGQREGFTTGACAAAAAKAATRMLVTGKAMESIESILPNRQRVTFALARCEWGAERNSAIVGILKDGGDDPDCTHGAEIIAKVSIHGGEGVELLGGAGVARVTKPGLGLEVGTAAINPVPRRNITEMVLSELEGTSWTGATVEISVPQGEEMAKKTINARLGLLGGISILGTSGIVKPYSTAAFRASVVQAIDVAKERGLSEVVLTTGGKSEAYAMKLHPELPEEAFIQMGDFVGTAVRHAARRGLGRVFIVGMMGKLSKMANGKMQTHAAGSEVNMDLLAEFARELGASSTWVEALRGANTARHALEICNEAGLTGVTRLVCERAAAHCAHHAGGGLHVDVTMVDFDGTVLANGARARDTSEPKSSLSTSLSESAEHNSNPEGNDEKP